MRHLPLILSTASMLLTLAACHHATRPRDVPRRAAVGKLDENRWLTPTHQLLTPAGRQVNLPGIRPQAIALSPNGRVLAVGSSAEELWVIDTVSGELTQKVKLPPDPVAAGSLGEKGTDLSATRRDRFSLGGLLFSRDGSRLYFSNVNGSIKVFAVTPEGRVAPESAFKLPPSGVAQRAAEVPAGLALSADGRRLYVVANLSNRLLELDAANGTVLRSWPVGVAPLEVALAQGKAYVSNQGGDVPREGEQTGPAGRGTRVRVDARSIAAEGSVSIIDLDGNAVKGEVKVGHHPGALAASPNGRYVVVANAGSDTLHVFDARTDMIVEKIWSRQTPADRFGAQPCALAFSPGGEQLYVCNSTQNAVAVIKFDPADHESRMLGLVPVGWFPAALAVDAGRGQLCVANLKGIGLAKVATPGESAKQRSRDFWGTLSIVPLPTKGTLAEGTRTALYNMRHPMLIEATLPARPGQPARPVPERVGEPSVFRHVIYLIKENRTYDQILGDMKEGNGDASLCTFGEQFTPNLHAIAREFVLLDNTYCSGVQSSDGHQWTDAGFVNDYLERQLVAAYPRSYPSGKDDFGADALNYASSGFIWDHVLASGKTFRNYGEWLSSEAGWADPQRKGKPTWLDFLNDHRNGTRHTKLGCRPAIEALRPHSKLDGIGWDLNVPDQMRADKFIEELKAFEAKGDLPNFIVLFLPNDHTAGTRAGSASPAAQVADNDLACGRVIEAISRSRFWPQTCVFAIEDDPQAGWDHVSGYRTTCYVVSPYTKRRVTISEHYNQLGLLRTMELILGVPPMNQLDATATPLTECFTSTPDFTPFKAVPARVSLEELNPAPKAIKDAQLRADAVMSARMALDKPDQIDDGAMNRILWRAMKGSKEPFPLWATAPDTDD